MTIGAVGYFLKRWVRKCCGRRFESKAISLGSLDHLSVTKRLLARESQTLDFNFVQLGISEEGGLLSRIESKSIFIEEIKAKQSKY